MITRLTLITALLALACIASAVELVPYLASRPVQAPSGAHDYILTVYSTAGGKQIRRTTLGLLGFVSQQRFSLYSAAHLGGSGTAGPQGPAGATGAQGIPGYPTVEIFQAYSAHRQAEITGTQNALKIRPAFDCYSGGIKQASCNPTWIVGPNVTKNVFKCRSSNRLSTFEICIDLK